MYMYLSHSHNIIKDCSYKIRLAWLVIIIITIIVYFIYMLVCICTYWKAILRSRDLILIRKFRLIVYLIAVGISFLVGQLALVLLSIVVAHILAFLIRQYLRLIIDILFFCFKFALFLWLKLVKVVGLRQFALFLRIVDTKIPITSAEAHIAIKWFLCYFWIVELLNSKLLIFVFSLCFKFRTTLIPGLSEYLMQSWKPV